MGNGRSRSSSINGLRKAIRSLNYTNVVIPIHMVTPNQKKIRKILSAQPPPRFSLGPLRDFLPGRMRWMDGDEMCGCDDRDAHPIM